MKTCEDVQNWQPVDTLRWTCTLTYRCMHRCTAVRTDSRLKLTGEPTQCCITPVYNRCWKTGMITHAREWMGWDILAVNSRHTDVHTSRGIGVTLLCHCAPLHQSVPLVIAHARTGTKSTNGAPCWNTPHAHTVKMERCFELKPEGEICRKT